MEGSFNSAEFFFYILNYNNYTFLQIFAHKIKKIQKFNFFYF